MLKARGSGWGGERKFAREACRVEWGRVGLVEWGVIGLRKNAFNLRNVLNESEAGG